MSAKKSTVCLWSSLMLVAAGAAHSQSETSSMGLEEIVVTAQKRAENLQDVPIAVSAVTGKMIDDMQTTSMQGLQGALPNVQINNFTNTPHGAVYTIRGIGVVESDPYAGNTVGIVVDGVPQFFSMGALLDLFDVERIEVLRGPQGTLFGANTTGGVVNVVTRQPTGQFGMRGEVAYGDYDRIDVKAAIDFPITSTLAGKIAYLHSERDGYYTNVVNGEDMGHIDLDVVRGYLKLEPGNGFDATLMIEYGEARNGAPPNVSGALPGELMYVPPGTLGSSPNSRGQYPSPCVTPGAPCSAPDRYLSANNTVRNISNMDNLRATLTMNLTDTVIGDITAISGYRDFKVVEDTDQDGTVLFLGDTQRETNGWQFSQELRTAIDFNERLNGIFGVFYQKTHYDGVQDFRLQFAVPGLSQITLQDQDNYSISGFAQLYYQATDALRLQAGVRYSHETTEMLASLDNCMDPSGVASWGCPANVGGFAVDGKESWDDTGWKLGADYKVADDMLVYGYWARGFKSGGFTGRVGIPQDIGPYDPETVDTFEIGFKGDFADGRARLNVAAFYTNYRDIQVASIYYLDQGTIQGNSILNAAKGEIKGIELEASVLPINGLTLSASVAYLDATYEKFDFVEAGIGGSTIRDLSGYDLQNAPNWTAAASATYEFDIDAGTITANASYSFVDEKYLGSLSSAPRSKIQATNLVNANVDFLHHSSSWSVGLWGTNLFDKRYLQSVFDSPGVFGIVNYQAPREYGARVRFFF